MIENVQLQLKTSKIIERGRMRIIPKDVLNSITRHGKGGGGDLMQWRLNGAWKTAGSGKV